MRFSDVMTRGDWIKLAFLIVIAGVLWGWVLVEYRKPFPDIASAQKLELPTP